jgi:hypothetical protein
MYSIFVNKIHRLGFYAQAFPCTIVYCMNDNTVLHCKKGYRFSRPQAGCHGPNAPWLGIIQLFPARRVWLVTFRLGTGKSITFLLQCILVQGTGGSFQHQGRLVPLQAKEQRLQHCPCFIVKN